MSAQGLRHQPPRSCSAPRLGLGLGLAVRGLALLGLAVQEQGKSEFSCEVSEIGAVEWKSSAGIRPARGAKPVSKWHKAKRTETRHTGEIYGRDIEGRRERDLNRYLLRHRHETGSNGKKREVTGSNYWYWPDELHPKPISSHAQSAHTPSPCPIASTCPH